VTTKLRAASLRADLLPNRCQHLTTQARVLMTLVALTLLQPTVKPSLMLLSPPITSPRSARIDPTLTVDDVVRQLCINLKIKDPPGNYALRDETDELVTSDNLGKKIKSKIPLKYVV
jgi:hypothetical protein